MSFAHAITERGARERAVRRENEQALQKEKEDEMRMRTARVRYETRPEVRAEGREMFQAQRDAAAAESRRIAAEHAWEVSLGRASLTRPHGALHMRIRMPVLVGVAQACLLYSAVPARCSYVSKSPRR